MSPMSAFARLEASARYRASLVARMEADRTPIRPSTPKEKIRMATSASRRALRPAQGAGAARASYPWGRTSARPRVGRQQQLQRRVGIAQLDSTHVVDVDAQRARLASATVDDVDLLQVRRRDRRRRTMRPRPLNVIEIGVARRARRTNALRPTSSLE
jgi:hypothetical protein